MNQTMKALSTAIMTMQAEMCMSVFVYIYVWEHVFKGGFKICCDLQLHWEMKLTGQKLHQIVLH